nr:MAG TPA: hypothetical protein [Bacteriophage sp.]
MRWITYPVVTITSKLPATLPGELRIDGSPLKRYIPGLL